MNIIKYTVLYPIAVISIVVACLFLVVYKQDRELSFLHDFNVKGIAFSSKEVVASIKNRSMFITFNDLNINNAHFSNSLAIKINPLGVIPFSNQKIFNLSINLSSQNAEANEDINFKDIFANHNLFKVISAISKFSSLSLLVDNHKINISDIDFKLLDDQDLHFNLDVKLDKNKSNVDLFCKLIDNSLLVEAKSSTTMKHHLHLPKNDTFINNVKGTILSNFTFKLSNNLKISDFQSEITTSDLEFIKGHFFQSSLYVKNGSAKIESSDLKSFSLKDINLDFGSYSVKGEGFLDEKTTDINIEISELNFAEVLDVWPIVSGENGRKWVKGNIKSAKTGKTKLELSFDATKDHSLKKINLSIPIYEANLSAVKKLDNAQNVSGQLSLIDDKLVISQIKGELANVVIENAEVEMDKLYDEISDFRFEGDLQGKLDDKLSIVNTLLDDKYKNLKAYHGDAISHLKITFPLSQKELTKEDINVVATSNISSFSGKFEDKYEIRNGNLSLKLEGNKLNISGDAKYEGRRGIKILYALDTKTELSKLDVSTVLSSDEIKNFGYSIPDRIIGNQFNTHLINESNKISIKVDLNNAAINLDELRISKNKGDPGSIKFYVIQNANGEYVPTTYELISRNLYSKGSMIINDKRIEITSDNTKIFGDQFGFKYKSTDQESELYVNKGVLNLSGIDISKIKSNGNKGSFKLNSSLDKIILKNNFVLEKPTFSISCLKHGCESIVLHGKNFRFDLNKKKLKLESSNAGEVIKGLGISEKIQDGSLLVLAEIQDDGSIKGEVSIAKYGLKKAHIFMKILALSSLTTPSGLATIFDKGSAMRFDKMSCSFVCKDSIIRLNQCVQKGSSITITADGEINLINNTINISGSVVPSNIVNSVIKSIPLIGKGLLGGENSGIISTNFTVKGDLNAPNISANPLTMFAPGFLKNIFGGSSSRKE